LIYWVAADGLLLRDRNSTKEAVGTLGLSNLFRAMRNAKLQTKLGWFAQDLDAAGTVVVSLESGSLSVLAASVEAAIAKVAAVAWFMPSNE
jgi:hypothetical protein